MQDTAFSKRGNLCTNHILQKCFLYGNKKKTHTKVNETTHFTTKVMLDFMKTISQFHYE